MADFLGLLGFWELLDSNIFFNWNQNISKDSNSTWIIFPAVYYIDSQCFLFFKQSSKILHFKPDSSNSSILTTKMQHSTFFQFIPLFNKSLYTTSNPFSKRFWPKDVIIYKWGGTDTFVDVSLNGKPTGRIRDSIIGQIFVSCFQPKHIRFRICIRVWAIFLELKTSKIKFCFKLFELWMFLKLET